MTGQAATQVVLVSQFLVTVLEQARAFLGQSPAAVLTFLTGDRHRPGDTISNVDRPVEKIDSEMFRMQIDNASDHFMSQDGRAGSGTRTFVGMQITAADRAAQYLNQDLARLEPGSFDFSTLQGRCVTCQDDRDAGIAHNAVNYVYLKAVRIGRSFGRALKFIRRREELS